jgi:hypothetical protein
MSAIADIAAERTRQVEVEGWSAAHDDTHETGDLAYAGACYALAGTGPALKEWLRLIIDRLWPWDRGWYKIANKSKRQRLVVAGALIVAEIERLDRSSVNPCQKE